MKIIDSITLGATIRARRKELGYTQSDLAEFTGFSISFISDLERGKKSGRDWKSFTVNSTVRNGYKNRKRGSDEIEYYLFIFEKNRKNRKYVGKIVGDSSVDACFFL